MEQGANQGYMNLRSDRTAPGRSVHQQALLRRMKKGIIIRLSITG